MASPYKIAYSKDEIKDIEKELNDLLKSKNIHKKYKVEIKYKEVKHKPQWEFYVVPK